MGLKDILVYLDEGDSNSERIKAAFALAKRHDARLTTITLASLIPEHLKISDNDMRANYAEQAAQQLAQIAAISVFLHLKNDYLNIF